MTLTQIKGYGIDLGLINKEKGYKLKYPGTNSQEAARLNTIALDFINSFGKTGLADDVTDSLEYCSIYLPQGKSSFKVLFVIDNPYVVDNHVQDIKAYDFDEAKKAIALDIKEALEEYCWSYNDNVTFKQEQLILHALDRVIDQSADFDYIAGPWVDNTKEQK